MPSAHRESTKTVSFAPELVDQREESPIQRSEQNAAGVMNQDPSTPSPVSRSSDIEDGTGRRFKIPFQENRLRFDQMYPEGLELRIPQSEFEIVLEQIHRELVKTIDKTQSSVRKWSVIVASTAPVGVGFALSVVLARRVHRHQKALKNFWLSLRSHLKTLNRDIYYARGIEWRIERDFEKIAEREAYNRLLSFRMEIVFRKPITLRSGREIALHSVIESNRTSAISSTITSANRNSRFSDDHLADPTLFALLATGPGGEDYTYPPVAETSAAGVGTSEFTNETIQEEDDEEDFVVDEDRNIYSSPFLVPDHVIVPDSPDDADDLFIKVEEPSEVKNARVTSTFEPPSPTPAGSVFTSADSPLLIKEDSNVPSEAEKKKMTFADLLRESVQEEQQQRKSTLESNKLNGTGVAVAAGAAAAVGLTAAMAATSLNRSPSPPKTTPELVPVASYNSTRQSREEAFAQRQRKKFSREPTLATQLYAIPESPKLGVDDDPAGDAMTYLNGSDDDDLIEDILGNSTIPVSTDNFETRPVANVHFEDVGPVPVAAYPMADPFTALYETDQVTPVDPPIETDEELEYTDVDGEVEYVRRKKWRVAPENADKLARVQTMSESIHPSSRRSSYLPVTKTRIMPKTVIFE